jgi:hypothetical protein
MENTTYTCGVCEKPIVGDDIDARHSLNDGEDCHANCCPECPNDGEYLVKAYEVRFSLDTMKITTVVYASDTGRAIREATAHLMGRYGIDVEGLDYSSVDVVEEGVLL